MFAYRRLAKKTANSKISPLHWVIWSCKKFSWRKTLTLGNWANIWAKQSGKSIKIWPDNWQFPTSQCSWVAGKQLHGLLENRPFMWFSTIMQTIPKSTNNYGWYVYHQKWGGFIPLKPPFRAGFHFQRSWCLPECPWPPWLERNSISNGWKKHETRIANDRPSWGLLGLNLISWDFAERKKWTLEAPYNIWG